MEQQEKHSHHRLMVSKEFIYKIEKSAMQYVEEEDGKCEYFLLFRAKL